jgi:transposase
MQFTELTDGQWDYLRPFLPPQPRVGRKRADDRRIINGILFVLTTGCRWRDVPRRYGAPVTAWRREAEAVVRGGGVCGIQSWRCSEMLRTSREVSLLM